MLRRCGLTLTILAALASGAAQAQRLLTPLNGTSMTGNDLLQGCLFDPNSVTVESFTTDQILEKIALSFYCEGLINGIGETLDALHLVIPNPDNPTLQLLAGVCLQQGLLQQGLMSYELKPVVVRYLEDHPDMLRQTATVAVIAALHDAVPCQSP